MDAQMKKSAIADNITVSNSISFHDEEKLWKEGALGSSRPEQLVETLFYEFGIHLSLRTSKAHRDIEFGGVVNSSCAMSRTESNTFNYIERCSKK